MRVGCHVPIAGGLPGAVDRAVERGCETLQIFSSNPRGWRRTSPRPEDIAAFRSRCAEACIFPVFVHTIYLLNLASPDTELRRRSVEALVADMEAAEAMGAEGVVTHLGSHGGEGVDAGIERAIASLREATGRKGAGVKLLLEITAGAGNAVGGKLSQLGRIINAFPPGAGLGVCFDTCHAFAAGYEIRTPRGLDETLGELDREIGLERLALVHANDSKGDLGSRLDRHEHIGKGKLGMGAFSLMTRHPALRDLPWILETPLMTAEHDRENMELLRSLAR